jgi:putative membrane-bound dehydrogenase-like protein
MRNAARGFGASLAGNDATILRGSAVHRRVSVSRYPGSINVKSRDFRRAGLWAAFSTLALAAGFPAHADEPKMREQKLNGRAFTLPEGFELELVAGPPLVERPITADFDELGRLYVADSSGSNDKVQKQLEDKPHRILRLEDSDGDGRFDKHTVFADKMMFPEGTMWLDGSLYVAAPPSIWKLTDTDGDGVADKRVEWFQGKTLTGCANDLHGPYFGPDGWIYWAKGAFAQQTYERTGKPPFVTRAAHIFRARRDGSGIEPVMTGGMDNPVDVVFTPGGERIFTTTFLQHPGGGRRDGLIHAIYGGVYGKVHDVIDGHKRTSPDVMPVLSHLGPAAPCGFTRYEAAVFGPEYKDNLFAACFNLHKITRHILTEEGATFTSRDEDFLSSELDFHPTDLLSDADGSLIVVDTGGWYKLCCPTSQLHKPDILGAIYRVRKTNATPLADGRGRAIPWKSLEPRDLLKLLSDPRPAVRARVVSEFAALGLKAIPSLEQAISGGRSGSADVDARLCAVWAATRIDNRLARALVRLALDDADDMVRQAAIHSISVWRDEFAEPRLMEIVSSGTPQNRRAAAEALGRIGGIEAVPLLLSAVSKPCDRALEHSLIYALIELADAAKTAVALSGQGPLAHRAALVALDQMDGSTLKPEQVTPDLTSADPATREIAYWIVGRHAEWGKPLAGFLRMRLEAHEGSESDRSDLERLLAKLAKSEAIQEVLAKELFDPAAPAEARVLALHAMAQSGLKAAPAAWLDTLAKRLEEREAPLRPQLVAAARALAIPKGYGGPLRAALVSVAEDPKASAAVRLDALAALPDGPGALSPALFSFLRAELTLDHVLSDRTTATDQLARAQLTPEQLESLTDSVRTAGPMEMDRLLAAFERSKDESLGLKLVAALKASHALSSVPPETLKKHLKDYSESVQREAQGLYDELSADAAQQRARLESMLGALSQGDIRRGQAVFNNAKVACVSCHAIGYLGGKVGPDLTRIGATRSERDLLEAIAFPSASFVRSYEPVLVATKDGRVVNGVLRKDAPDEVILAVNATEEAKIPRDQIEEMRPGTVSVMPSGLDQQLTTQELSDLVAFLKACK